MAAGRGLRVFFVSLDVENSGNCRIEYLVRIIVWQILCAARPFALDVLTYFVQLAYFVILNYFPFINII